MSVIDWLDAIDKNLFSVIHHDGAVPALDGIMKGLRMPATWIPVYAFLLYWVFRHMKEQAILFIICSVVVVGITDYSSASIFKPLFSRLRPCYEEDLQPIMRHLVGCGGKNSFPSSHAANHFGMASFWFAAIYSIRKVRWYWLWIWAFVIGYAQVYVGKHYPFDIVGGAILGVSVGLLIALIFKKWSSRPPKFAHGQLPHLN